MVATSEVQSASERGAETSSRNEDLRPPTFRRRPLLQIAVFVVVAVLATRPFVDQPASMHYLNQWLVYAIAGTGFYLMFVVVGRFAFCQTFMMSTGGYVAAYLSRESGFLYSLLIAVVVVVVVSGIFALIVARTESFLFAVATLALGQIGATVYIHWNDFTGPNGVSSNVPYPEVFGFSLTTEGDLFWMFLVGVIVCVLVVLLIERSAVGRESVATRERAEVARSVGIPTLHIQTVLFVIGSAMGGLAGAMTAFWQGSMSTETFTLDLALGLFLIPILGGVASVWGTVLGAFIYVELTNVLSGLEKFASLTYGIALLLVIVLLPQGILGVGSRITAKLGLDRSGSRSARSARTLFGKGGSRAED